MTEVTAKKKPLTRTELISLLAERADLNKQEVAGVLDVLTSLIGESLAASGAGSFTLPGLLKIERKETPARPGGTKPNPFRPGETMEVAAKPASTKVKLTALKGLKELAPPGQ